MLFTSPYNWIDVKSKNFFKSLKKYFLNRLLLKNCDYFVCKYIYFFYVVKDTKQLFTALERREKKYEFHANNNTTAMTLCMDDIYIYGNDIEVKANLQQQHHSTVTTL